MLAYLCIYGIKRQNGIKTKSNEITDEFEKYINKRKEELKKEEKKEYINYKNNKIIIIKGKDFETDSFYVENFLDLDEFRKIKGKFKSEFDIKNLKEDIDCMISKLLKFKFKLTGLTMNFKLFLKDFLQVIIAYLVDHKYNYILIPILKTLNLSLSFRKTNLYIHNHNVELYDFDEFKKLITELINFIEVICDVLFAPYLED